MARQWDASAQDYELIDACLAGDETAWAALIQRYRRLIYTIPLRFGMPPAAAEEIFQEVCLTLLQKLHTLRDQARLSAWIVTVARRACIKHWRQSPASASLDDLADQSAEYDGDMDEELLILERRHTLQQALERLDERCRQLLEALFLADPPPSYQQLARSLDMPEGSIGPTRARCLQKLRHIVAEIGGR
jgi:RNA polymerase sigma factor (sigma-70 family)